MQQSFSLSGHRGAPKPEGYRKDACDALKAELDNLRSVPWRFLLEPKRTAKYLESYDSSPELAP